MQCRLEIMLTLPATLEAHTDIFLRENNHYAGMRHKSSGSRWVSCGADNVRERQEIIREGN